MSKMTKTVLIITAILIACLIGAGIVLGITARDANGQWHFSNMIDGEKFEIDEAQGFDLTGVSAMRVDCTSGNIKFVVSDETKVTLTGVVITRGQQDEYLSVYEQDGTLYVEVEFEDQWFNIHTDMKLTIYLPSDNNLDLSVDSTSGNINMADMRFGDIRIKKTSGDAMIDGCTAKTMEYDSSSGNTNISGSRFGSMDIVSTSGDIEISKTPGDITIRSTSGNVGIMDADGTLDIGSTSGDVTIDMASADIAPVTVGITSGNLRLYMYENTAFDFDAKTTSGNISSDIEIAISGKLGKSFVGDNVSGSANGGGALVRLNTTSGNIRITEK